MRKRVEPQIYKYDISEIPSKLDERMKYYENLSQTITKIDPTYPFIVRLDGRCFSKFTKKLKKINNQPYSTDFKEAMVKTCHDLLQEFRPSTIYTHSDEITMIFDRAISDNGFIHAHLFGGRVFKILSLISSFASVRFNNNINTTNVQSDFSKKVSIVHNPTFDARIIVFPEDHEIVNHMIWRSKYDCYRNFVSMYAMQYMSKKQLNNISTPDRIESLKSFGVFLDDYKIDQSLKHGIFMKLHVPQNNDESQKDNIFMKLHVSQNNDESLTSFYVFKNLNYSEYMYEFLLAKNDSYIDINDLHIHDVIMT
jgi:tRNA(His) 5'-end guanylyltransferase